MLALLTGPPGVGKTTVATGLAARFPGQVETVSFGAQIYRAVNQRCEGGLSYDEFRKQAAGLVTHADIMAAAEAIVGRKSVLGNRWLLVDSHAAAQTSYGWQAHPDTPETLRRFGYDRIIHLYAPAPVILARSRGQAGGRHITDTDHIETLSRLQLSISTYYAGILGCTLDVVDAAAEAADVARTLAELLKLGR